MLPKGILHFISPVLVVVPKDFQKAALKARCAGLSGRTPEDTNCRVQALLLQCAVSVW